MEFSGKNTGVCCCFPPGDLPDTGMGLVSPVSLHWQANTLLLSHLGKHYGRYFILIFNCWFLYIGIKYWNIFFRYSNSWFLYVDLYFANMFSSLICIMVFFVDSFGFSLYIIICSVYLMFSMNEEFDFFPSNCTSFFFSCLIAPPRAYNPMLYRNRKDGSFCLILYLKRKNSVFDH